MKKKILFFVLFCLIAGFAGYYFFYSKPSKDNMNEKIQNVFFDTPFGANREELIKNFEKHGFDVYKDLSTATDVSFFPVDTTSYRSKKKYY